MQVGELFVVMGLDMSQYDAAMKQAEKKANTLGGILRNALSFTLGMGLFETIKQGFRTVIGEAVNFNSMMEQARIGFTTMLGSAERAEVFLRDMANFAAKTPFEFPELLDASKRMLAYGFAAGDVLPIMEAVGNATAALGLGAEGINRIILALGQMRAKGKLSGEEMRQLTEAGVPAWEMLAEAMGFSADEVGKVMDMASKGLIPADRAIKMLVEGMNKRFPDMMKNMENTWEGVTSTIKDVWRMTVGSITVELFKGVTGWLQRLRDMATNFYQVFSTLRQQGVDTATALRYAITYAFGEGVGTVANVIITTVQRIWEVFARAAVIIRTYWESIRYVLTTVLTTLFMFKVVLPIINNFIKLVGILNGSITATSGLFGLLSKAVAIYRDQLITADVMGTVAITRFTQMRIAVSALISAFGALRLAILGVAALILGPLMWAWSKYAEHVQKTNMAKLNAQLQASVGGLDKSLGGLANTSIQAGKGINDLGKNTAKASKKAKGSLAPFDEINQIFRNTADAAGDIAGLDIPAITAPGAPGISAAIPSIDVGDIFDFEGEKPTIKGFFKWLWEETKKIWNKIVNWVKNLKLWEAVKKGWESFIKWAGEMWSGVKEKWSQFVNWVASWKIWDGIKRNWNNFIDWAKGIWDGVKKKWSDFTAWVSKTWTNLKNDASKTWETIRSTIVQKTDTLKTSVANAWNSIKNTIQTRWNELKSSASITWNTINNTIQNLWNSLKSNASTIWNNIRSTIQNSWNTLKSSAPGVWDSIKSSIQSRWNSLKSSASTTWSSISSTVQNSWNSLKSNAPSVWENIRSSIVGKWNSLKSSAASIWDSIKSTISSRLNSIKNLFNFSWSLPKIKLPRFTVKWSTSGFWGSIGKFLGLPGKPIIDVTWLAKGGLITAPMVAGLGEAGREAVIPLDTNTGWADIMADRLVSALQRTQVAGASAGGGDIYVYIGNEQIDAYIYRSQDRRNIRSNGR